MINKRLVILAVLTSVALPSLAWAQSLPESRLRRIVPRPPVPMPNPIPQGWVWVPPVYKTVVRQVWVPPVYRTVYDRVWEAPVYRTMTERVWVPDVWGWQAAWCWENGAWVQRQQYVVV